MREALIDFANNNLTYSEKRTPISPEKDAWNVHNDIVTGYYEQHKLDESKYTESDAIDNNRTLSKNAYLLNEEPVSSPLDTFKSLEDAIAQPIKQRL